MIQKLFILIIYTLLVNIAVLFAYDKYIVPKKVKKIYSIDSTKIIELQKKRMKELIFNKGQKVNEEAIIKYLNNIDKIINYIAERDNAIVVVKQSIASKNVKDITNEVLTIYRSKIGSLP
ncbi:hypothetical protein [Nitrosophilus labii]|uniref:hypothetical protein n=1 Tax=Nitrosophilus labii TaxID=2706014 RepID=UPI0016572A16|nr:hypothetical protein [Nitrosophilus labii]